VRTLTLYIRINCHLCDEMRNDLLPWSTRLGFQLTVKDIDEDEKLIEQYQYKIPVLTEQAAEICHFFLDEEMLQKHFSDRLV